NPGTPSASPVPVLRETATLEAPAMTTRAVPESFAVRPASVPRPALSSWRHIGNLSGGFVLFEGADGLVSLNVAAARARIYYEKCLADMEAAACQWQGLLFPIVVELSPTHAAALEQGLELFKQGGFQIEDFGQWSYRVTGVPTWFDGDRAEDFVKNAASALAEGGLRVGRDPLAARESFARLAAAHASGGPAPADEVQSLELAGRLLACKNPIFDPRGNPTIVEITRRELAGLRRR
ncbi:MAG TPA: hypothetical protein PKI32_05550, partial [Opitutales bacterium]|nr:hypothetical protein [Opitutales bacterium]